MITISSILSNHIKNSITSVLGQDYVDIDPQVTVSTNRKFGDYQANFAMSLASRLDKKPRDIAEAIIAHLDVSDICSDVTIAGPGFINFSLNNKLINRHLILMASDAHHGLNIPETKQTIVIDYSAPNVAKEMHVGHLRSTIIGDALTRVLQSFGHNVIRQNHLGDWGTQFGMLIEHLVETGWNESAGDRTISNLNELYQDAKQKFDNDEGFAERSRSRVVSLQSGDTESIKIWQFLIDESKRHFEEIYSSLGVLLKESDLCPESFYNSRLADVIDDLERQGLLTESDGATVIYPDGFKDRDGEPMAMIVRKSDGGYLYASTDLAAARYRIKELHADRMIYVTDARQAQHFAMLFDTVKKTDWFKHTIRIEHVPFGSVLGHDKKPFKTREGGTISLTELLREAEQRAMQTVRQKNTGIAESELKATAHTIGIGALKYADLSNDRIKDYVFDWDRMLSLEGNTAPYLQNAYVRISSIFRKGDIDPATVNSDKISINEVAERELALILFQYPDIVQSVAERLEPHRLCNYLFELASCFHVFYENCPVLKEDVAEDTRASRLALCSLTANILQHGLNLLGIETVERM